MYSASKDKQTSSSNNLKLSTSSTTTAGKVSIMIHDYSNIRECTNEKNKNYRTHTQSWTLRFFWISICASGARMMEVESLTTYECFVCETWDLLAYNVPIQFCAVVRCMPCHMTSRLLMENWVSSLLYVLRCMCKALSVRYVSELLQFVTDFPIDKKNNSFVFSLCMAMMMSRREHPIGDVDADDN